MRKTSSSVVVLTPKSSTPTLSAWAWVRVRVRVRARDRARDRARARVRARARARVRIRGRRRGRGRGRGRVRFLSAWASRASKRQRKRPVSLPGSCTSTVRFESSMMLAAGTCCRMSARSGAGEAAAAARLLEADPDGGEALVAVRR